LRERIKERGSITSKSPSSYPLPSRERPSPVKGEGKKRGGREKQKE
jgi:hypothetical protein